MTRRHRNSGHKEMHRAVRLREQRSERLKREGEWPVWRNLSMIGALGWLIVAPTLLGVLVGRWLDHAFETGILFTAALIFMGIAIGSYFAWQRVNRE